MAYTRLPQWDTCCGLQVYRPRYLFLPWLGGYRHPALMQPAVVRTVRQLRREWEFDLIDVHWAYPTGVAAVRLGQRIGKPVVITGRGEDMLRFPSYPFKARQIRWAVRHAEHCIALSREIAQAFEECGADPARISVIPNGVDTEKFRPLPRNEARKKLELPVNAKIILSVGDRLELKGFHLLVEALPEIRRQHPEAVIVIVGGPGRHGRDYTEVIVRRIAQLGLEDSVRIAGRQPHEDLAWWYSAADVFALLSSREGSPNVLLEALACGTPAVATAVGGIPDELANPRLGLLLAERSAQSAANGLTAALSRTWDRNTLSVAMQQRSWATTAGQVARILDNTVPRAMEK
jgi:teichuronic acid biosynthesis glycosyltransferase TuaC